MNSFATHIFLNKPLICPHVNALITAHEPLESLKATLPFKNNYTTLLFSMTDVSYLVLINLFSCANIISEMMSEDNYLRPKCNGWNAVIFMMGHFKGGGKLK